MAANCALYPHNWAVWGGFNKINKLTGRPPPAPEARGGQSLTKDQFVIATRCVRVSITHIKSFLPSFRARYTQNYFLSCK